MGNRIEGPGNAGWLPNLELRDGKVAVVMRVRLTPRASAASLAAGSPTGG